MSASSFFSSVDAQRHTSGEFCCGSRSTCTGTTAGGAPDQAAVDGGIDQPRAGQAV